jgi:hypothetical protein
VVLTIVRSRSLIGRVRHCVSERVADVAGAFGPEITRCLTPPGTPLLLKYFPCKYAMREVNTFRKVTVARCCWVNTWTRARSTSASQHGRDRCSAICVAAICSSLALTFHHAAKCIWTARYLRRSVSHTLYRTPLYLVEPPVTLRRV